MLTEKSTRLRETGHDAAFAEARSTRRRSLSSRRRCQQDRDPRAIEKLFSVSVTDVHTQVMRGKKKRVGRYIGRRPRRKKAIVTLQAGQSIEFFEGV